MTEKADIGGEELSYEEAFARLETLIATLEDGDLPLDEALARYEEGVHLAKLCERLLKAAELRVRQWQADDAPTELTNWQEE